MWGTRPSCFLITTLLLLFTVCTVVSGDAESSDVYNEVGLRVAMDQDLLSGGYASIQSFSELKIANTASMPITIHSISVAKEKTWLVSSFGNQYDDEIDHLPQQINIMRLPLTPDGDVITLDENQSATFGVSFLPRYPARLEEAISRTSETFQNNVQGIPGQASTPHGRSNLGYLQKYRQEEDERYLVKTYIFIETSKGSIRLPVRASSIRKNIFGLPDTITFQTRLPKQPFQQFDCFDLHITNPSHDSDLSIWQASFSRKDWMELRFDVGYSQSSVGNPQGRVNPEWRGQGAQVLAPGAHEVYMASLCARPYNIGDDNIPDSVIDQEFPDNGFRDTSLGYLQILMPDVKLYIWMQFAAPLSLYPDDFPARLLNGLHIVSDNGVNFEPPYYKVLESIPKTYIDESDQPTRIPPFPEIPTRVKHRPILLHPTVADIRMLPAVNETFTMEFDIENTLDYYIDIRSETSLLPSASTANSVGLELELHFKPFPPPEEHVHIGSSHRMLPPRALLKGALTLTCTLNSNKTLPLLEKRTKPIQLFGEILFHATYNLTHDFDSWKERQMWCPMKESHLTLHLPYAVTATAGKMFVSYFNNLREDMNANEALSFQHHESTTSPARGDASERLLAITTSIPMPMKISSFHITDGSSTSNKVEKDVSICDNFEIFDVSGEYDVNGSDQTGILAVRYNPKTNSRFGDTSSMKSCYLHMHFDPVDAGLLPLELRVYNGKLDVVMEEHEGIQFNSFADSVDLSVPPIIGFTKVFEELERPWVPIFNEVLPRLYGEKEAKELKPNQQEELFRRYLKDLGGSSNASLQSLDPVLLKFGATGEGEIQTASLFLTNWNPTPITIAIDVREVQGMTVELGRDSARKKGDRNNILDFLPDESEEGNSMIAKGEWAGHTRNGLRRYLLTSELARSFFTTLSHRDAVSLDPSISKSNHYLKKLYSESIVNVTFHSSSLLPKEPPIYENCTDTGYPAIVISSDLHITHASSICREHQRKRDDKPVVSIPPGGAARFEVKLRAPKKNSLKQDFTSFLATGLVLSADTGQVIPLIATYEVLLGQLKVSSSHQWSESTTDSGRAQSETIHVPVRLFEDGRIEDNRTTYIRIPPGGLKQESSGFQTDLGTDSHAVPLFLTSTFSGDVCLKKIDSCSPLFKVVLEEENSTSVAKDITNVKNGVGKGLKIGTLSSFLSCTSPVRNTGAEEELSELPEFPSFYQCALSWLENRSLLQPRGCGVNFNKKGKNTETDEDDTDSFRQSQEDAIERAIVAFKNVVSYLSLSYGGWREFNAHLQQLNPEPRNIARPPSGTTPGIISDSTSSASIEASNKDFFGSLVEDDAFKSVFQDVLSKTPGFENGKVMSISTTPVENDFNDNGIPITAGGHSEDVPITTIDISVDKSVVTNARMSDTMKSGGGRGDGTVALKKINMFAEASDAWKLASEFGLNTLSTSLKATIDSSTGNTGCKIKSDAGSHLHTASMQGLNVEASLQTPRLFDHTRSKQHTSKSLQLKDGLSSLDFPPTLVSNVAGLTLPLRNPTSVPVRVRLAAVSAFGGQTKDDGEGDDPNFRAVRDHFLTKSDGIYIQNRKANIHEDYGGQLWWEGGGAFYLCDDEGNMIQSHHNLTIKAGAGAQVSLMNPSLHGTSAFLLGCGVRCGDRENPQDGKGGFAQVDKGIGTMPKRFTPIGAAAAAGITLLGHPQGGDDDVENLYLGAGGAPPNLQGPAPFAVPYSALDEIILPPFGEGELGPILFRPPGRRSVLGCDLSKDNAGSQHNIQEACQRKYFESLIFLENSLTGLERVVLRGQGLWERVEFRDAESDDGSDYGDIEYRHGHSTLVFPGTGELENIGGAAKSVVKRVVVHNSGDIRADFGKIYFSDAAIGHLVEPGSLHESRRDKNTLKIGREGNRCEFHNFRLLGCEDKSKDGFSILPGHNRTLYIEHTADCSLRQEYVALNFEYRQENHSSTGSSDAGGFANFIGRRRVKANIWEKSFRKRKISLLVGFDMDHDTISNCIPVQSMTFSGSGSLFEDRDWQGSSDLKVNGTAVEQDSGCSSYFNAYLEGLFFTLALVIAASRVAKGVHSRSQWCSSFQSGICSSAFHKGNEAPTLSTSTDNSDWSAAFRCLARADPSSSDLQLLGREQVRQVVANRYKSMGIVAPQSLTNFGCTPRDRPGRNTASGPGRTGKEGAGGEKIRTLSDAIFQDFIRDTRLPCGLGWRAAAARGIGTSSDIQMPQKVRELQMRRHHLRRPKISHGKTTRKQVSNGASSTNTSTHDEDGVSDTEEVIIVDELNKPDIAAHITKPSKVPADNSGNDGFAPVVSTSRSQRHAVKKSLSKSSNDDDSVSVAETPAASQKSDVLNYSDEETPKFEKASATKPKFSDTAGTANLIAVDVKAEATSLERAEKAGQPAPKAKKLSASQRHHEVNREDQMSNRRSEMSEIDKQQKHTEAKTTKGSNILMRDSRSPWGGASQSGSKLLTEDLPLMTKEKSKTAPDEKKITIPKNPERPITKLQKGGFGDTSDLDSQNSSIGQPRPKKAESTEKMGKKSANTQTKTNASMQHTKLTSGPKKKMHGAPPGFDIESPSSATGNLTSSLSPSFLAKPSPTKTESPPSLQVSPPAVRPPPGLAPPPGFAAASISSQGSQSSRCSLPLPPIPSIEEPHLNTPEDLLSLLVPRTDEPLDKAELSLQLNNYSPTEPLLTPLSVQRSNASLIGELGGSTLAKVPSTPSSPMGPVPSLSSSLDGPLLNNQNLLEETQNNNGFNVMDFLDSILDEPKDDEEGPGINDDGVGGSLSYALQSDPWAADKKSRASAYGIAVEESNDHPDEVDLVQVLLANNSTPLLTPASILGVTESESAGEEEEAPRYRSRSNTFHKSLLGE